MGTNHIPGNTQAQASAFDVHLLGIIQTNAGLKDFVDVVVGNLEDAIQRLRECKPLSEMLGELFVQAFCEVKELEFATYSRVISSWEREHLMLLV